MTQSVVDANVPIVANGRDGDYHPDCQEACVDALHAIMRRGRVYIDGAGAILTEYARYLNHSGQPGFGDAYFRFVIQNQGNPKRVRTIELLFDEGRQQYVDFPTDARLANFDPSDRKYAACARKAQKPVLNAVDSDWLHHRAALDDNGIRVEFICGINCKKWFR
jgi:hypothetical protein